MLSQAQTLIRNVGPYSRDAAIAKPKRRTKESRFLQQIRADLTTHVGGHPTATQKLLIERVAMTLLRLELMDRAALEDPSGTLGATQTKHYLAWENTAARMLRQLGLKGAPKRAVPLHDRDWSNDAT